MAALIWAWHHCVSRMLWFCSHNLIWQYISDSDLIRFTGVLWKCIWGSQHSASSYNSIRSHFKSAIVCSAFTAWQVVTWCPASNPASILCGRRSWMSESPQSREAEPKQAWGGTGADDLKKKRLMLSEHRWQDGVFSVCSSEQRCRESEQHPYYSSMRTRQHTH